MPNQRLKVTLHLASHRTACYSIQLAWVPPVLSIRLLTQFSHLNEWSGSATIIITGHVFCKKNWGIRELRNVEHLELICGEFCWTRERILWVYNQRDQLRPSDCWNLALCGYFGGLRMLPNYVVREFVRRLRNCICWSCPEIPPSTYCEVTAGFKPAGHNTLPTTTRWLHMEMCCPCVG